MISLEQHITQLLAGFESISPAKGPDSEHPTKTLIKRKGYITEVATEVETLQMYNLFSFTAQGMQPIRFQVSSPRSRESKKYHLAFFSLLSELSRSAEQATIIYRIETKNPVKRTVELISAEAGIALRPYPKEPLRVVSSHYA